MLTSTLLALLLLPEDAAAASVYPPPRQMESRNGEFVFDETVRIVLPEKHSPNDLLLARLLTAELSDWYAIPIRRLTAVQAPAKGRRVVMGDVSNPLVAQYAARFKLEVSASKPGPEGYVLHVATDLVLIAGSDARGAFCGLESLRQLIGKTDGRVTVPAVEIRDWPSRPLRFFRLYMPSREDMPFFKKLVRDVVALYKYNALILETSGAVRFDRHREINAGWIEFAKDLNYSRRDRAWGTNQEFMDSGHHDVSHPYRRLIRPQACAQILGYDTAVQDRKGGWYAFLETCSRFPSVPPRRECAGAGIPRHLAGHDYGPVAGRRAESYGDA